MSARKLWLELDWDAPAAGLEILATYVRNIRTGDPAELAIPSGDLSEEAAGTRFVELAQAEPLIAERWRWLPDIVIYSGPIPADVPDAERLLAVGASAVHRLRGDMARYVVVTPVLNQVAWAETFEPVPGFRHLIIDNASDDGTADVLVERGADVIRETERVGRVDNWRRAANRFLEHSDAEWMKWVFAGDGLLPDAASLLDRALSLYPDVKLIASEYEWRRGDGIVVPFCSLPETRVVHPPESAERFAIQGNWLGGPIALLLHRDEVANMEFGQHPFVGDWQASMEIALRTPVLYLKSGPIGFFDGGRDRYHTQRDRDVYTMVQDAAMRYQALVRAGELAPDKDFTEAREMLDQRFFGLVAARAKESAPPASARPRGGGGGGGGKKRSSSRRR
jgi:hypothetical protein